MTSPVSSSHPAARARGAHLASTIEAIGQLVRLVGGEHRSVALAALAVRGAEGRSREAFAAAYGIGVDLVAAMELGQIPAEQIPAPLSALTPIDHLLA